MVTFLFSLLGQNTFVVFGSDTSNIMKSVNGRPELVQYKQLKYVVL